MLTAPGWWHQRDRDSQIKLESTDLLRIRSRECVESNQGIKASHVVVAPLPFGRRRCTDDMAERRRTVILDAAMLRTEMEAMECMGRIRSSPRSCRARRRGRSWWGGGDRRWPDFGMPSSPRTIRNLPACMAWSRRMRESRRSSGASRRNSGWSLAAARGTAGARVSVMLAEMSKKEEEWGSGAYPLCQCTFYSPRRAATPSCASARRRWIECWEKLHRAAWLLEEEDDCAKRYAAIGLGRCWASAR
jgi:hypothetical protein